MLGKLRAIFRREKAAESYRVLDTHGRTKLLVRAFKWIPAEAKYIPVVRIENPPARLFNGKEVSEVS